MKLSKKEALNEVAKVLQAALSEYEALEKMDFEGEEKENEDEDEMAAQAAGQESQEAPAEEQEYEDEQQEDEQSDEQSDEDAPVAEEEGEEEDDQPMDDETLKSEHSKLSAEMAKRGLSKSEKIAKSESSDLKKYETQVSDLQKTVNELQATISKIANTPAPRKGATGYNPLKKNTDEEATPLNKGMAIDKLLNLKKSGNRNVSTSLINRLEGDRLTNEDVTLIKGLIG